jgi:hypothetical protein
MIYDALGRLVIVLVSKKQNSGVYQVEWESKNIASGIYFCVLKTAVKSETKKLILIK